MSKLDDFLLSGGWSLETLDRFRRSISQFLATYPDPSNCSAEQFSTWLTSRDWSSSTIWVAYTAIRLYLRWLYGNSHPALLFKYVRQDCGPQRALNLDQVKKLLYSFDSGSNKGIRDLAICSLFLDSGLRCSEMCNLELRYLHLDQFSLDVLVKGGHWRSAIFSQNTALNIDRWLSIRKSIALPETKTVFTSLGGNTSGSKFTRSGLQRTIKYWGDAISIPLSPHDLRRTFATLATRAGAPSSVLQVAGRWSNIQMVQRYTRSITLEDFKSYFPLDYIMKS